MKEAEETHDSEQDTASAAEGEAFLPLETEERFRQDMETYPVLRDLWEGRAVHSDSWLPTDPVLALLYVLAVRMYERDDLWRLLRRCSHARAKLDGVDGSYVGRLISRAIGMARQYYRNVGPARWLEARLEAVESELNARLVVAESNVSALHQTIRQLETFRKGIIESDGPSGESAGGFPA